MAATGKAHSLSMAEGPHLRVLETGKRVFAQFGELGGGSVVVARTRVGIIILLEALPSGIKADGFVVYMFGDI